MGSAAASRSDQPHPQNGTGVARLGDAGPHIREREDLLVLLDLVDAVGQDPRPVAGSAAALFVQAVALHRRGDVVQAVDVLAGSVDIARRDGVRPARRTDGSVVGDHILVAVPTSTEPSADRLVIASLSPREHDVLVLLAQGCTNKDIAQHLGLRPKTVMHHCAGIYRKLGVANRTEAAAVAVRSDLSPH